jgi:HD superfamily phosphohydrolase
MNPYGGDDFDQKTFTLPVSGAVRLWGPEVGVIGERAFQRLAGIKQLGTAYLAFRGAVHTRFEHSLGTLHEAARLIEAVNRNPLSPAIIGPEEERLIRMGALLHDITHIPFGHTLEDEFGLYPRHDDNEARRVRLLDESDLGKRLRSQLGRDGWKEFRALLDAVGSEGGAAALSWPFAADIIGNTVCADMLDYVPRDLNACGMPVQIGDRFLDYFAISSETGLRTIDRRRMALNLEKRGMPRPDVESEVVKLLTYRYELVERVYFHHAKNSASVMLARAVQEAGFVEDHSFDKLSDDSLLLALHDPSVARALHVRRRRRSAEERAVASELADRIAFRDLYKIAYMGVYDDLTDRVDELSSVYRNPDARLEIENELARMAGLRPGHVLVHVPPARMLLKLAEVRVLTHRGGVTTLDKWDERHSRRAGALNNAHRSLWRITAYVHPSASVRQRKLIRSAGEEVFGAPSRYVKPSRAGSYLREVFDQNASTEGWTADDWDAVKEVAALGSTMDLADVVGVLRGAVRASRRRHDGGAR